MHGTRSERPESQRFCCKNVLFKRYGSFNVLVLCHLELLMNAEKSLKLTTPMSPAETSEVGRHEKLTSNGHSLWLWPFFIIYFFIQIRPLFIFAVTYSAVQYLARDLNSVHLHRSCFKAPKKTNRNVQHKTILLREWLDISSSDATKLCKHPRK